MKKIVCELCEGTEFTKEGGFFVCHGCGTKYSLEEAKGMMKEVEGDVAPLSSAVPVATLPVNNPNEQQIDNMLLLASNAYEASNLSEAETYCNQVIALDAMSYKAWQLKGKAAGWQSSLAKPRIKEAAHSFSQAFDFVPEDEKEELKTQMCEELLRMGTALATLRKNHFADFPNEGNLTGFISDLEVMIGALQTLQQKGIHSPTLIGDYQRSIGELMNQAAVDAFQKIRDNFQKKSKPDRNDFHNTLEQADNCVTLISQAITIDKDDNYEDAIIRYKNMIAIYEYTIQMKGYANYSDKYPNWMLTDEAKTARRNQIKLWDTQKTAAETQLELRKAEERIKKQERIKAYWEAHAEEKAALDTEMERLSERKSALDSEIAKLNDEIKAAKADERSIVPSQLETNKLRDQIRDLNKRKDNLGVFSGKEKRQISEQITILEGRIQSLKGKIDQEEKEKTTVIQQRISSAQKEIEGLDSERTAVTKRISAIEVELTKDPEE